MFRPDPLEHCIEDGQPIYHPISVRKLVILSVATGGLYQLAWFYRNWWLVGVRKRQRYSAIARSLFFIVFIYPLFRDIRASADRYGVITALSPGAVAASYLIFGFIALVDDSLLPIGVLTVIPLAMVQALVNRINAVVAPDAYRNEQLTGLQKVFTPIGCLFFLVIIIEPVMMEQRQIWKPPPPIWTQVGQYRLESEILTVVFELEALDESHGESPDPWPIYLYMDADEDLYTNVQRDDLPDSSNKRSVRVWRDGFAIYGCATQGHCNIELYDSEMPEIGPQNQLKIHIPVQFLPDLPLRMWSAHFPVRVGEIRLPSSEGNRQPRRYPYVVLQHQ